MIYKITSPSGKVYIGLTSNFRKRMSYYKNNGIHSQRRLHASFCKYGYENHFVEVIDRFTSDTDYAHSKEMFWIRSFMSNICKWRGMSGLNLTDGGQGTLGYKFDEETRKKLSEYHKRNPSRGMLGKKISDEQKEKMRHTMRVNGYMKPPKVKPTREETKRKQSLAKIGKTPWNKGIPMSEAQKEKLKVANTGRPSWNKGLKFQGTKDERKQKFGSHNIGNTYNKGRKHREDVVEAMRQRMIGKPNVRLYKPVIQYSLAGDFIREHESVKNASADTGLSCWTISNIAKGRMQKPDKFIFKFK